MHHQIGITTNRTGEMQVIDFLQAIMPERTRIVARAFETLQQTDFQCLFFRLSTKLSQQSLQFSAIRQVPHLVTKTEREFTVLCKLFRIWVFMNTIDGWDCSFF